MFKTVQKDPIPSLKTVQNPVLWGRASLVGVCNSFLAF
ncbi:hypothetical protein [Acidianus two-tailed virus 2]|nr:hypothetical protein [Acidianus two-tailed virus 2]